MKAMICQSQHTRKAKRQENMSEAKILGDGYFDGSSKFRECWTGVNLSPSIPKSSGWRGQGLAPGYVGPVHTKVSFLTIHLCPRNTVFLARSDKVPLRMKLTDCLNEVDQNILPHISRLNELINIMLVSHHFQHLAELLLHRTINFKVASITKEYVNLESSNESLDDTLHSL